MSNRPRSKFTLFFDTVSPYSWLAFEVAARYEKIWTSVDFDFIPVFLVSHPTLPKRQSQLTLCSREE
jgi:hypothetical protein